MYAALSACVILIVLASLLWPYARGDPARAADKALATSDFAAFYCASLAARNGTDPYKTASLEACQRDRVYRPGGLSFETNGVNPAPLPGYDFAFFAPLTLLPYRDAGLLWIGILVAANLAAAAVLQRLTGLPFGLLLAVLGIINGAICYEFGQEQPLVTLPLVTAALLLRAERPRAAAAVASLTLIEPHVGLPIVLTLLLWTPTRLVLAVACAAFGALSFATIGPAANVEYFARVLPVHAFAEIPVWFQYSLTSVLYTLGVPDAWSLRIASLQYALTAAGAILLAGPVARRIGAPALVLFPAACAVFGGPFIHIQQIASALPFALYLATCVPGTRAWGWAACVLLALQWPATSRSSEALGAVILLGATACVLAARPLVQRAATALIALTLYFSVSELLGDAPYATTRALPSVNAVAAATAKYDPALASTRWAIALRRDRNRSEVSLRRDFERLPAWLALYIVCGAGVALRRRAPVTL